MESTEKCEAIIQHFNGKYIKTPPGVAGNTCVAWFHFVLGIMLTARLTLQNNMFAFSAYRTLAV